MKSKKGRGQFLFTVAIAVAYIFLFMNYRSNAVNLNRTIGWGWDTIPDQYFNLLWVPILLISYWWNTSGFLVFNKWISGLVILAAIALLIAYLPFVFYKHALAYHGLMVLLYILLAINMFVGIYRRTERE